VREDDTSAVASLDRLRWLAEPLGGLMTDATPTPPKTPDWGYPTLILMGL